MDWKEDAGLKMHLFIHLIPQLVGSLFGGLLVLPFFWFAVHLFLFLSLCLVQGGQTSRWGKALKVDLGRREYDYLLESFFFLFLSMFVLGMPTVDPVF